ncbi:hypothetical protein J3R83DRAFT_13811 [Lanmaoa asiatica]|nr:hypothetical protein J3R83DRAFT_13811 [Lanmaoa asiatica]
MATNGGTSTTINLSNSWGSTLAAVFVALVFYGVSILQTYAARSFTTSGQFKRELGTVSDVLTKISYQKDTIILKSLVAWVFVLDTLHTILISLGVWQYFVVNFGDDSFLTYTHAPLLISIVVTSAVSSTVQSFFIYRIWFLVKSRFRWLIPAILMPFVVAQLAQLTFNLAVYAVTAMVFQTSVSAVSGPLLTDVANALNGVAMAVDVTITICLCTLLAMGRTGFADTDQMLLRLIFISVNTGLSSAIFAFLSVLLVRVQHSFLAPPFPNTHRPLFLASRRQLVVYPTDLIFTALYYPLCTVYCNTLLASLNARAFARGGSEMRRLNPLTSLVWQQHTVADTDTDLERMEV